MNSSLHKGSAIDWLLERHELAKKLNEESKGDCLSGTVATPASPRARAGLGQSGSVNYRKEGDR